MQSKNRWLKVSDSDLQKEHLSSVMNPILNSLVLVNKGLFALHRKIWFGVYKKIENFVITNFFVFVIAFALETC